MDISKNIFPEDKTQTILQKWTKFEENIHNLRRYIYAFVDLCSSVIRINTQTPL